MTPEEALAREAAQLERIHTLTEQDFTYVARGLTTFATIRVPNGQHIIPLAHVQKFATDVDAATGEDSFGTYIGHEPTAEQAVDCFVSVSDRTVGDAITGFAIANMDKYGIWYVIYRQRIYNPEIGKYWRDMADRGGVTANHFDHVHLSFYEKINGEDNNPVPPVDVPTKEDKVAYVEIGPGKRVLIPVPVVNGGGGVKKAAVTVMAPNPGAIIGTAKTWRDEKPIVGLAHNPSFKGLVNFDLEAGVEGVEIENLSPNVVVTVMVEVLA